MTISQPKPHFTDSDRRLLELMASVLEKQKSHDGSASNLPPGEIGLSLSEEAELASRLEEFVGSQRFALAGAFIENVTSTKYEDEQRAKEIFLSERRRRGRTRAMSGALWADLRFRLGIGTSGSVGTQPMSIGYFERMERRLLLAAGLSNIVTEAVLGLVRSQRDEIDRIRLRQRTLRQGLIREALIAPLSVRPRTFRVIRVG